MALTVNRKEKKLFPKRAHTRGFVYVKKSRDILREVAIGQPSVEDWHKTALTGGGSERFGA